MNRKFWSFRRPKAEDGATVIPDRELRIEGVIAEEESWFYDTVTPSEFRDELAKESGNLTVWIHSPGGDVFAAAQIYNALRNYKGKVTVKVDGLAASAASVIAMSGDEVQISPVGQFMVHNPWTLCVGDAAEMQKTIEALNSCKESIIEAYRRKTGLSHSKLSALMDSEKWIYAREAVELGFADKIIGDVDASTLPVNSLFSQREYMGKLMARMTAKPLNQAKNQTTVQSCYTRLNLISGGKRYE